MNQLDLNNQTAIVTGGARGIGFAIATRLLQSGASVCLWDRDEAALGDAAKKLAPLGNVQTVVVDVTSETSTEAAAEATAQHSGKISARPR